MNRFPQQYADYFPKGHPQRNEAEAPDTATVDEIEREIALQAKGATADFLTAMRDKFGKFDLPDAARLEGLLIETFENEMHNRMKVARAAWGEA
jgi:hypothetical protein